MHRIQYSVLGCLALASCLCPFSETAFADENSDADRFPPLAQAKLDASKSAASQSDAKNEGSPNAKSRPIPPAGLNDAQQEREAAVLKFVGSHQPRLLKLLEYLKQKQPSQYQQAYREVSRAMQRLQSLEKRDEELYAVELKLWQTRCQLRLLAAEMAVPKNRDDKTLEERLSLLVEREANQDIARLKLQRERAAQQLKQLDSQIESKVNDREEAMAKSLKIWHGRIAKQAPASKSRNKKP